MRAKTLPMESDFWQRWFVAVDDLTPQESASILTRTSSAVFVEFMRHFLPPQDSRGVTDDQLHALHHVMCERLEIKANSPAGHSLLWLSMPAAFTAQMQ